MYYKFNADRLPHISHMNLYNDSRIYTHPRRIPGEYLLLFVKSGILPIREDHTDYYLGEGDLLILNPESVHEGIRPSSDSHYYIHLSPDVFSPFTLPIKSTLPEFLNMNAELNRTVSPDSREMYERSALILPKTMTVTDLKVRHKFELAMEQAIFAADHRLENYKLICSTCFMQIITELAAYFSTNARAVANEHFTKQQQAVLACLTEYLHTHFDCKLTGADLEREFGMSFDYLNRLFKKKNGLPIFSYLNTLRIGKAVELLVSGNTKLFDIARTVGYSDEYYFSKMFKKQLGVSPKNYLKLYQ